MKYTLFTLGMILFCAQTAHAAETQTIEESGFEKPVLLDEAAVEDAPKHNFVINVSWKDYIDSDITTTNLNNVEPAAGGSNGDGSIEEGFTVSLTDQVVASPTPRVFELAYTTRKNFSLRTKHSGLMFYKKYKFEPHAIRDTMPDAGNDIGKPEFTQ